MYPSHVYHSSMCYKGANDTCANDARAHMLWVHMIHV